MAKNAAKKRRSGTRKVSKKQKNTFRYKKPDISSATVRELWDNNLTAETNMAKMGLRQSANRDIRPAANRAAARSVPGGRLVEADEVSRLFDVADTADLKVIDRNYGRRPMSDEDQRYTAKLMAKHGLNQVAMARDIKVNYKQLTLGQLRRMCDKLLALGDNQRVVALPERASKEAAGSRNNASLAISVAMEEDGGSEDDDGVAAQKEAKEEKMKRRKGKAKTQSSE
eukprot:g16027.t1